MLLIIYDINNNYGNSDDINNDNYGNSDDINNDNYGNSDDINDKMVPVV